ncbi:MAG: SDR family NAD(P)-dependent oxidoreductase [Novosphingobium sp.]|uniref:SDR family NAD(P)-dependent oxidoreductase n=1 Tax=Novosphingobium sp. TaxID=1874826 RepID=UPI0032BA4DE0
MDFTKLFSLEGKVALITGGSRGIGKMLLEGFLAAGCEKVYITARKRKQIAETLAEFEAQYPGKVIGLPGDLSQMDEIKRLAEELAARESKLDILVNNAGAAWGADFEQFPEAGWDKVMDLNVKSLFFLTQKLFPLLKAAGSFDRPAKVINIASIDGLRPNPWETYSYQASKAAVVHLTKRMAARLIQDNIVVTAIAPGAFPSEMNKAAAKNPEGSAKGIPFHRVGMAEDMAAGAIYLASRAGDYVVGTTIPIDGGIVNGWVPEVFNDPSGH